MILKKRSEIKIFSSGSLHFSNTILNNSTKIKYFIKDYKIISLKDKVNMKPTFYKQYQNYKKKYF